MNRLFTLILYCVFFAGFTHAQNEINLSSEQASQDQYFVRNVNLIQETLRPNIEPIQNNLIQKASDVHMAAFPEVLYYKFDETGLDTTQNLAVPGQGLDYAQILGGQSMGPTGQFGDALIGAGGNGATTFVNTGWNMNTGTSSWTISLWINNYPAGTFGYIFGNDITTSFRCFSAGAAGTGNITLRGTGMANVDVTGVLPGPTNVHFVYDATVPEIRAYVNGILQSTVPQSALNIISAAPLKVGSYNSSVNTSIPVGALLDEFRFYSRALDATEIAATWNDPLPVELTSFTASVTGSDVKLLWETATELNNSGFSVERKSDGSDYEQVGFIPGFGTTSEPKSYSYYDQNLQSNHYTYRLKQIDFDGTFEYSSEVDVDVITVNEFSLDQNYPNPFNPSTNITFSLATDSKVSLKVFDVTGQEVASLLNQNMTAGAHNYVFDAADFNSGVYFYTLQAGSFLETKKMILMK